MVKSSHESKGFGMASMAPSAWAILRSEEHIHMSKILVIDDDTIVRTTIVLLLEDAGHQVRWAVDGLRGMALFRSAQPDLVITDIIMPEQEGIQTISEMRKARPDAKIIAISGSGSFGNADFLKMARSLGAMDVIAKPFDPDVLLAIVKNCLAGRAGRSTPGQAT
jgi:DNA-binding response OmpR family regulator